MASITDGISAGKTQFNSNTKTDSTGKKKGLEATDFINIMIQQLQNQDPTEPTKSSDLLAQMSQIGSLQANTDLQTNLKNMTLQNGISNAAAMIGKTVTGKDTDGSDMDGIVTSVKVADGNLSLLLDSGKSITMNNVLTVAPTTGAAATPTPTPGKKAA